MARPRQRVCLQDGSTAKPLGAAYSKLSSSQPPRKGACSGSTAPRGHFHRAAANAGQTGR
jgi:hypothetical protein